MKIAVDTNVLVHAHIPAMEHHESVHHRLSRYLQAEDIDLVVTPLVLHELVHVITDARRFDPPVPMPEAIEVVRGYLSRTNVQCLVMDEPTLVLALDLLDRYRLGRKRIADTLLAASLLRHGVRRFLTFNRRDFAIFDQLLLEDPLVEGP